MKHIRNEAILELLCNLNKDNNNLSRIINAHNHFWGHIDNNILDYTYDIRFDSLEPIYDENQEINDYKISLILSSKHDCHDYSDQMYININGSWLYAKDNEEPWLDTWINDLFYYIKLQLNQSPYLKKHPKENIISELLAISPKSLEDIKNNEKKLIQLKNIYFCLKIISTHNYGFTESPNKYVYYSFNKGFFKDIYDFLVNARFEFDETDLEDGTTSVINFLRASDHVLSPREMIDFLNQVNSYEVKLKEEEKELALFKSLEAKYKGKN